MSTNALVGLVVVGLSLDATPRPPQPAVTARSTTVTAVAAFTEAGRRVSGPSATDHIEAYDAVWAA
jgi:hypothetical protein